MENEELNFDTLLWDILNGHVGHHVHVASYGKRDNPITIALKCEDCGVIILDAGLVTICAREDV